jgi:hypothetical protein
MAVKLVNGLLDVSAPTKSGDASRVSIDSESCVCSDSQQFSEYPPAIPGSFDEHVTRGVSAKAQVAFEKLKRYSAGREREELRSVAHAEQLAMMIASRIVEDDAGARDAHSELATCTAQGHLMQ